MRNPFLPAALLLAAVLSACQHLPQAAAPDAPAPNASWERSIVELEVTRKQYDYYQPWARRQARTVKTGLVVGPRQILTTAEGMNDITLVRLQKNGRGKWYLGEVTWVDYAANLALVTTTKAEGEVFWTDLQPVKFNGARPAGGTLQILRWREGNLENRMTEFTQYTVREGRLAALNQAQLEVSSEIQAVGRGEPVVADARVVGILTGQDGRNCTALPASFIQTVLDAHTQGTYRGLGYFHFFWQQAENPATLASLKLAGEPRGVLVTQVSARPDGATNVLKPRDLILQIDGFDVDIQGDYTDPEFGHLMIENLAIRKKWADDDVKMKIWRDGQPLDVTYRLPKFEYTNSLLPDATYDQEPEYLIVGGLIFQPLTDSYLQSWGANWTRNAPFRLNYYNNEEPTKERPALVILSQVLPDAYNIGYQENRYLVVDKVNGQRITWLTELRDAFQKPVDGFHVVEFMPGESLRRMVLDAGDAERAATERVLQRFSIADAYRFTTKPAK